MSWARVDFSLVRYSPVEGTHYFYDPAYPQAIQFLLNGRWESWDVGWVKYKAQDPDLKRIAEDAEARLLRDRVAGYRQWPAAPPSEPAVRDHEVSPALDVSPLPSPSPHEHHPPTARLQPPAAHQDEPGPANPRPYHSPYANQPTPPISSPEQPRQAPPTPTVRQPSLGNGVHSPVGAARPLREPEPFSPLESVRSLGPDDLFVSHRESALREQLSPRDRAPPHEPPTPREHLPPGEQPVPNEYSPLADEYPRSPGAPPIILPRIRETKILLSLDGDGVRGLSQVLLVESLVNAICTKIGAQIEPYQIFDLIGGTSLGGVFAIMLSRLRMQAHRAREAYRVIAKEVFPNKRDFFISCDPHAPPVTHDGKAVEDAIKSLVTREAGNLDALLYDQREDSSDVFAVSTRVDIGTNKAALMRSYQTRRITGPETDANMTIWEAMRAASVAPRYMHPRDGINWRPVIEPGLVDHGTVKNNPIRDILYECRKLYRYANDMMVMVSIGTGIGFDGDREMPEMAKSVTDRTLEASVWCEKFEAEHAALIERGWMKYYRFNVPGLDDVPLEEWCHEERIKAKTLAYLGKPEVGQMFYACVDAITAVLTGGHQVPR